VENNLTEISGIIVVGTVADRFGRNAADWLKQRGIRFISTENIYSVTALICQMDNRGRVFVIGTIEELSKEDMRFFDVAAELGNITCCGVAQNTNLLSKKIADNPAVLVIDKFDNLTGESSPIFVADRPPDKNEKISLNRNDYALSEDETSALLELK